MDEYLEIPLSQLRGVTYTTSEHKYDDLEVSFMETIARATGFFEARIKLKEVKKTKYSRNFDYFAFEYDGENYILEKGALKKGNI